MWRGSSLLDLCPMPPHMESMHHRQQQRQTRNRFEFIQLQSGAAVINNQIEMPSITWNVCLMKRAEGLKNGNYNVIPKRGPSLAFFSGLISILSSFFSRTIDFDGKVSLHRLIHQSRVH